MKLLFTFTLCFSALVAKGQTEFQTWKVYYDSTQIYWGTNWPKIVSLLESAERIARIDLGIYDENYLTIINDLGIAYWKANDLNHAQQYLEKTVALKSEVFEPSDASLISSICNLASFYSGHNRLDNAKHLYLLVLNNPDVNHASQNYLFASKGLINYYDLKNQSDSALHVIKSLDEALLEAKPYEQYEFKLIEAHHLSKIKEYTRSKTILESLRNDIAREEEFESLRISALQELALIDLETGYYNSAEKMLLHALREANAGNVDNKLRIEVCNNLANVYDKLNIYDKALAYYEESLARCEVIYGNSSHAYSVVEANIAGIQLKQGFNREAIARYEALITKLRKTTSSRDRLFITSVNNLATAYRNNSDFESAQTWMDTALSLIHKYNYENHELGSVVFNNAGVLEMSQGDYNNASTYFDRAYGIKSTIYGENSPLLMEVINNLAVVNWALGKPDIALPLFKKSNSLAIKQVKYIFPGLNETEQIQFYRNLKENFERFNTIAVQHSSADPELLTQMFNNQTLIKSILFVVGQKRSHLIDELRDTVVISNLEEIRLKREMLGHYYQLPRQQVTASHIDLAHLEKEIYDLEKKISLQTSDILTETLLYYQCDFSKIKTKLTEDEALVEIVRFRKYDFLKDKITNKPIFGFTDSVEYAALVITASNPLPVPVLLKNGVNFETRFLKYYNNTLRYNVDDENSYAAYWQPIEQAVGEKSTIYVCGDGIYHKLNLNTFRDPAANKFVLEKFDIHYLTNASQLLTEKSVATKNNSAVLIGDPVFDEDLSYSSSVRSVESDLVALPGTLEEILTVDKILTTKKWSTQLHLKTAAKESTVKKVKSPSILHIATHGFFSSDIVRVNPLIEKDFLFHSGLLLTGATTTLKYGSTDPNDDGILTSFDVMNLDLTGTDLVVLSACETGLGKIENGEGVFGLQRSFQQAGAKNVMISLWKVDDAVTKDLMVKFYQYYTAGKSIRESLKQSQLDLLALHKDPRLWGGFVVVGSNE